MVVLEFPRGLPGFERHQRFTLSTEEPPLAVLKSADADGPCFHAIPVTAVDPDYQIGITLEDLQALGLTENRPDEDGLLCLAILAAAEGGVTANLLAPVIVNLRTGVSVQAVRADARYSPRHWLGSHCEETPECS